MRIETKRKTIQFTNLSHSKVHTKEATVNFNEQIQSMWVSIEGVELHFTNGEHPVMGIEFAADPTVVGPDNTSVKIFAKLGWYDNSHAGDDSISGHIKVAISAVLP